MRGTTRVCAIHVERRKENKLDIKFGKKESP
jgi:hypothetical protein